jgi:hypothetical protein
LHHGGGPDRRATTQHAPARARAHRKLALALRAAQGGCERPKPCRPGRCLRARARMLGLPHWQISGLQNRCGIGAFMN